MFSFALFGDAGPQRPFNTQYRCYSVSMFPGGDKQDVEKGGKIIMPPSALDVLTRLNIVYPMLFKLTNRKVNKTTHCGVLEFVADEGKIYIPYWMMRNLLLDEGDFIQVESVSLPIAEFSKFEPQNVEFLDISNPKAVLENALRNFACLTSEDMIAIKYNDRIYEMRVLEVKPGTAVSIIECDMNVEFAAPVGYQEPKKPEPTEHEDMEEEHEISAEHAGFLPFLGSGNRLDGKNRNLTMSSEERSRVIPKQRGIPDYDYEIGCGYIKFWRLPPKAAPKPEEPEESFEAFKGSGASVRKGKKSG